MEVVKNISVPQLPGHHLTTPQFYIPSVHGYRMVMVMFICTDEELGAVDTLCFSLKAPLGFKLTHLPQLSTSNCRLLRRLQYETSVHVMSF